MKRKAAEFVSVTPSLEAPAEMHLRIWLYDYRHDADGQIVPTNGPPRTFCGAEGDARSVRSPEVLFTGYAKHEVFCEACLTEARRRFAARVGK